MATAEGRMKLRVYLDEGHRAAEIFVSPTTQCKDIVHRLRRQIHATDCFLLEVWQGCERLVPDNESILTTLLEWGSDLEDVKFYLRRREETRACTQVLNGPALSHEVNGFKKEVPLSRDVLLGGSRISVNELKEFAVRQQQEIITKERELKTKQIQLMEMKRKSQNRPQNSYIQQLTAKTDEQGEKLTALRKVQDQIDSYKLSNSALAEELEGVRSLFMEKEKELVIAVAKVESLTQQLDKQRQGWSQTSPSREKTHQQLELERLRKELMTRNELNHQQSVQIQAQKQLLAEKRKELFELDTQIDQYTEKLKQKRAQNNLINHNPNQDDSSSLPSPAGEMDFVEMDYSNLPNFAKRANKSSAFDSNNASTPVTSSSVRLRSRTSNKLETLIEVEEEVSDGHASSKSSTEDLTEGPGPPRASRVTLLKSRFEVHGAENRGVPRSVGGRLVNGKTNCTECVVAPDKILNNSPQRVDPEGVETPQSPSPELLVNEERQRYSNNDKDLLNISSFETKPYHQDSKAKRETHQQSSTEAGQLDMKHIFSEPDLQSETQSLNSGQTTPSDEEDISGMSSPSSLSSLSSVSSNSASPKAAMFALSGIVKKAEKSLCAHESVRCENASSVDERVSLLQDFHGPHTGKYSEPLPAEPTEGSREVLDAKGALCSPKGESFPVRHVKTEGFPTRNENVGSLSRPTVLDFSRAGTKFTQVEVTGKSRDVPSSNHSDDGYHGNDVKKGSLKHVTSVMGTVKTGKIQLSRLRYRTVSAVKVNQDIINNRVSQTFLKRDGEDQSSKKRRKTEASLNADQKETHFSANATRLSMDPAGTTGCIQTEGEELTSGQSKGQREFALKHLSQENKFSASTSRLLQSLNVTNFIQKEEVTTLPGSGSLSVIVPSRHAKTDAEFSIENKVRKPEQNTLLSRLPADCVVQEGGEVLFSPYEGTENITAPFGQTKGKAHLLLRNNLQKTEQSASLLRLPQNSVSTDSPTQIEGAVSSPSLHSLNVTTPTEESKKKSEFPVKENRGTTELKVSESNMPISSPSVNSVIPNGEEVTPSPSSTPSNGNKILHRTEDVKDETDDAKISDKENDMKPSLGQAQFAPLTFKPISYRAKKLATERQGDLTSANQSHPVPTKSNSVSVLGQSSLTKITVTPSATFLSSAITDIPEKRSPVPSGKRPRLKNRVTGPSYPEVKDLRISNGYGEESSQVNEGEKEAGSLSDWVERDEIDLFSDETNKNLQQRQKPRNLARSGDVKQVVSSFNIQLSSQSRKAAREKKDASPSRESNKSNVKSSGLLIAGSKYVAPKEMNSNSRRLISENGRVILENDRPFSGSGALNSESNRSLLVRDHLNLKSGKSLPIEVNSKTMLKNNTDKLTLMQNQATDEDKASPVQEEKTGLKSSFILDANSNSVDSGETVLVSSRSEIKEIKEVAVAKILSPRKASDDRAITVEGNDLVAYSKQAIKSVSDQLSSDNLLKPAVLIKDTGVTLIGQSNHPMSDQLPDNSSVSKITEDTSPSYEVFSNHETASQKADRKKKTRHVSLDPHAVLLDAAVEGELELVKQIVVEVDDPSKPNSDGITALHNAVCAGHDEVVKFLVQYGCNVNSQDSHGWTPLHCAAANNATEIVRFLVEHGACVLAVTSLEKKTPVQCCERGQAGYFNCMSYLNDLQENFGISNKGRVHALYSYTADEEDELSFECGEKLVVLKRGDSTEREWWWAENMKGQTGYIPRNLLGSHARVSPVV